MNGQAADLEVAAIPLEDLPPPPRKPSSGQTSGIRSDQNTAALTIGGNGRGGLPHLFRRSYHIVVFTSCSFLYYYFYVEIGQVFRVSAAKLMTILALAQIVIELVRIRFKFVCFGFRSYEADQVSAQAWGTVGAAIVLIAAPQKRRFVPDQTFADRALIGMPILWTLGIIDPLIGELKAHGIFGKLYRPGTGFSTLQRCCIATVAVWAIWGGIGAVIGESVWWLVVIMGPLSVAAEYPKVPFIDDNAMMELVPLAVSWLLSPFFPF